MINSNEIELREQKLIDGNNLHSVELEPSRWDNGANCIETFSSERNAMIFRG